MPRSEKDKIEGRFVRFYVTCTHTNTVDGGIESSVTSSCVVFKVTGNLTREYIRRLLPIIMKPLFFNHGEIVFQPW